MCLPLLSSVQFISVVQLCPTLCDPMNRHCWPRSYPRGPLSSDGHTNTTRSWRVGLWDLPELGRGEGDPYLGSSLGSVGNLLCDSEYDVCFLSGSLFPLTAK